MDRNLASLDLGLGWGASGLGVPFVSRVSGSVLSRFRIGPQLPDPNACSPKSTHQFCFQEHSILPQPLKQFQHRTFNTFGYHLRSLLCFSVIPLWPGFTVSMEGAPAPVAQKVCHSCRVQKDLGQFYDRRGNGRIVADCLECRDRQKAAVSLTVMISFRFVRLTCNRELHQGLAFRL